MLKICLNTMRKFSILISTINRPTLADTLKSIYAQTYRNYEIKVGYDPNVNEYYVRNILAKESKGDILAILDDDAMADKNWLKIANEIFSDPDVIIATGVVIGDLLGTGNIILDRKYWGIGTNMFIRKKEFLEVGGFEVNWGFEKARGWRSDTHLLWTILERYGEKAYVHSNELKVYHPKQFQSVWDPRIEMKFYLRWKEMCLKHLVPYDPRLCQLILGIEEDENIRNQVQKYLDKFIETGIIKKDVVDAGIEFARKLKGTIFSN